jgi:CheY-like chemotaxis protein
MLQLLNTMFASQAQAKGVQFNADCSQLPAGEIIGDCLRLNQILMNLLSNAVKFTPAGGSVHLEASLLQAKEYSRVIRFVVRDTGIGMNPAYLQHLFQPFEQESASTARQFGGTGLGLSITKNLITMMHGSIDVQSSPGQGSCFTVIIEFALPADSSQPASQPPVPAVESADNLMGLHILLAEDNEMNQEIATYQLEHIGLQVTTASNGQEAIDHFLAAAPGFYAAILMDIQMPVMDGLTATRRIRASQHPDAARIPILAVTADAFVEDAAKAMAAGMNDHIAKPIDCNQLLKALHTHIAPAEQDTP